MAKDKSDTRRSPCPVSCTLDIIGDRWTLLVIRDLMLGKSRYKEFCASPEGIPTNILAERLERLLQYEIIEKAPVSPGSKRMAYHLTPKGKALKPLLIEITRWGLQWEQGTEAKMLKKNPES